MIDWVTLIAFVIWILSSGFLLLRLYAKRKKNIELATKLVQATIDRTEVIKKLSEVMQELENKKLEESDGFLKFISESRDWAFNYIEETQEAIKKFSTIMDQEIKYFETYGQTMASHHSPNLERIAEAYKDLVKILPNEQGEKK